MDLFTAIRQFLFIKMKHNLARSHPVKTMASNGSKEEIDYKMKENFKSSLSAKAKWKIVRNAFYKNRSKDVVNKNGTLKDDKNTNTIHVLTLRSLEPTSPDLMKKEWIQLSGHDNTFKLASPGTIWKKCSSDEIELQAYEQLRHDILYSFVPEYFGNIVYEGNRLMEIQDLLYGFHKPCVMDIKMGTRTFLESEVSNNKPRTDLYTKMIKIDKSAPTSSEHEMKAVTKLRYMRYREELSSSSTLGFRIEGFKSKDETIETNLCFVRSRDDVKIILNRFLPQSNKNQIVNYIIDRLSLLKSTLMASQFFRDHEIIGSSLLVIYDNTKVGVWMIDFAKSVPLENIKIDHVSKWIYGNHEDGYLYGINNLIDVLEDYRLT